VTRDADRAFGAVADALTKRQDVTAGRMFASDGLKVHGKVFASTSTPVMVGA